MRNLKHEHARGVQERTGRRAHEGRAHHCAKAEPGSPLENVPFGMTDLDTFVQGIGSMVKATLARKVTTFGVSVGVHRSIDSNWKKVCLEVGLGEDDVKAFGEGWKAFTEAYAGADSALIRSGKPSTASAFDAFPEASTWATQITGVWRLISTAITAAVDADAIDTLLNQDWCRRVRGGLVCMVLGMKWWGVHIQISRDEDAHRNWSTILEEMSAAFKVIAGAESLLWGRLAALTFSRIDFPPMITTAMSNSGDIHQIEGYWIWVRRDFSELEKAQWKYYWG
ncbi:hypothetical protein B0H11DRAFT_1905306 [Mycena galericulata]|nr:hypothetical protein B0H11DRAFT_1905306 [Mycena galericulata]